MIDTIGVIFGLVGSGLITVTNLKLRLLGFSVWVISDAALIIWSPSQALQVMYGVYAFFAVLGIYNTSKALKQPKCITDEEQAAIDKIDADIDRMTKSIVEFDND